ncbi:hypothetical protein ACCO45_001233 [Purpureocillium lilacinum]|uniref:Uncharacterized protein n=1 Tax=Purpureocillium lilacinum TaxID=33203 RepID=A0ACC4E929_PURLI
MSCARSAGGGRSSRRAWPANAAPPRGSLSRRYASKPGTLSSAGSGWFARRHPQKTPAARTPDPKGPAQRRPYAPVDPSTSSHFSALVALVLPKPAPPLLLSTGLSLGGALTRTSTRPPTLFPLPRRSLSDGWCETCLSWASILFLLLLPFPANTRWSRSFCSRLGDRSVQPTAGRKPSSPASSPRSPFLVHCVLLAVSLGPSAHRPPPRHPTCGPPLSLFLTSDPPPPRNE